MLLNNGDGTYTAGPLDAVVILHHNETGRYHVSLFEEHKDLGPIPMVGETRVVRLISRMHHTEGAETLEGAKVQRQEMLSKLTLPAENVFEEVADWDGTLGVVLWKEYWREE